LSERCRALISPDIELVGAGIDQLPLASRFPGLRLMICYGTLFDSWQRGAPGYRSSGSLTLDRACDSMLFGKLSC
jgi:hypothetical protein